MNGGHFLSPPSSLPLSVFRYRAGKSVAGIGYHLGFGLALTFMYILFMQISSVFGQFGTIPPILAVWIPNIFFGFVALLLIRLAPK